MKASPVVAKTHEEMLWKGPAVLEDTPGGDAAHRTYNAVMGRGTYVTSWDRWSSAADAAKLLFWEVWAPVALRWQCVSS